MSEVELSEVLRTIRETPIQCDWQYDHDLGEEIEIEDARMTLENAALRVNVTFGANASKDLNAQVAAQEIVDLLKPGRTVREKNVYTEAVAKIITQRL